MAVEPRNPGARARDPDDKRGTSGKLREAHAILGNQELSDFATFPAIGLSVRTPALWIILLYQGVLLGGLMPQIDLACGLITD